MTEALLAALLRQTLLLTIATAALLALRRPLLRRFGAGLTYARWALLPLVLAVGALPVAAPVRVVTTRLVQQFAPILQAPTLTLPEGPASSASLWLALWLTGTVLVLALMFRQQRRLLRGLTRDGSHWWAAPGDGPALVGLLRPRVVLPRDFATRFDAREQRLVLAHEDVHRRRLDNLWNLLATLLCALNWFNPLAWLALRGLRADQELACDAAVMRAHPNCEVPYGRALMAAQGGPASLMLPWACWTSPHPLLERIAMLDQHLVSRQRRLVGRGLLAATALLAAGLVHALNATPSPTPDARRVHLKLHIVVNDPARGQQTFDPSLIVEQGETGRIVIDGRESKPVGAALALGLTPSIQADGKIKVGFSFDPNPPHQIQVRAAALEGSTRARQLSMVVDSTQPGRFEWTDADHTKVTVDLAATAL